MTISQLEYFLAVVQTGGFTAAARRCRVAQPSLSQQIQKLEDELGGPLFQRGARSVKLTQAGQMLLPRAQRILKEVRETSELFASPPSEATAPRLAIGAIPTMAPYIFPITIARFTRQFPDAGITITEDLTGPLVDRLVRGELDMALMSTPPSAKGIEWEVIAREPFLLAVSSHSPLAKKRRVAFPAVRQFPMIVLNQMHCLGSQTQEVCQSRRLAATVSCETSQLSTLQQLVARGLGVSLIPQICAHAAPEKGVHYLRLDSPSGRDVVLAWPRGAEPGPVVKEFADILKSNYLAGIASGSH